MALSPLQVGTLRIFTAGVCLFPFSLKWYPRFSRRQLLLAGTSGLVASLGPAVLFAVAGTRLNSSVSGSLNAMTPFFTIVIAAIAFRQRINLQKSMGLLLGLTGCVVLSFSKAQGAGSVSINGYAGFVVLATILYGININLVKHFLAGIPALGLASISTTLTAVPAGLILFSTDFLSRVQTSPNGYSSVGYVIILGAFGTALSLILFNQLIAVSSVLFSSSSTYLIPVFAILWGVLDGEKLLPVHGIGVVSVLGGVMLVTRDFSTFRLFGGGAKAGSEKK